MEFKKEIGRIYAEDSAGKLIAEVTFPQISEKVININHTFVDQSLRGRGVANKLIEAVVEIMKAEGLKAVATCSYAKSWFDNHPEYAELIHTHE